MVRCDICNSDLSLHGVIDPIRGELVCKVCATVVPAPPMDVPRNRAVSMSVPVSAAPLRTYIGPYNGGSRRLQKSLTKMH